MSFDGIVTGGLWCGTGGGSTTFVAGLVVVEVEDTLALTVEVEATQIQTVTVEQQGACSIVVECLSDQHTQQWLGFVNGAGPYTEGDILAADSLVTSLNRDGGFDRQIGPAVDQYLVHVVEETSTPFIAAEYITDDFLETDVSEVQTGLLMNSLRGVISCRVVRSDFRLRTSSSRFERRT
jgi:hypothetical protein